MHTDEIIYPTDERLAKGDVYVVQSDRGGVAIKVRRSNNDMLAYYFNQGHITQEQLRAGTRYRVLYQYGYEMRERYVTMRFGTVAGEIDEERLADNARAYQAARAAIRTVAGKNLAFNVCCFGMKAGRRAGMENLRIALDDLVDHFGYRK